LESNEGKRFNLSSNILLQVLVAAVLLTLSVWFGRGNYRRPILKGLVAGLLAGLVMGVAAIIITKFILNLPWYAAPRLFASIVMGKLALADILHFDLSSFTLGLIVLLALTAVLGAIFTFIGRSNNSLRTVASAIFYSLSGWVLLQYIIFPVISPIIVEKGFPPNWFALAFAIYGTALGLIQVVRR
jgi:hypothetical protein